MNYNQINHHDRDEHIHFDEASHTYTVSGRVFKSVTTLVGECFEQFDADYWAEKKAPAMGMTPEELKALWERKGEEARNLGTMMHEKIERHYLGLPNSSDDTYRLFEQFIDYYHLTPYRTEWTIYDEESGIAGTLDFLNLHQGIFTIFDWKRSNKILVCGAPETTNRWGKCAFSPISHIPDTIYWHYALQLSIYRYILEKNYGIHVSSGKLGVFHPDNGRPYVVDVPYMRNEVIALLNR
jgi:hypothetical protein